MKKVVLSKTCDLDHAEPADATVTLGFTWNGRAIEVDLCPSHLEDLNLDALAERGRKAVRRRAPRVASSGAAASPEANDSVDLKAVREWARSKGLTVSDRGRVAAAIIAQYRQAVAA